MIETREISALFTLIDDPDEDVYCSVSNRIIEFGRGIIPNLEHLWENSTSEGVQERIEMLIHRLHFTDLITDFTEWNNNPYHDLLFGSLLVGKYQYPDLQTAPVLQELEKIRRNVWLELNSYLTPLEQANVINSIVYNYYKLKGSEINYTNPDEYFTHKVLESKKGNAISNGILYLILAELLDIPVKAINVPKQFILAFPHTDFDASEADHPADAISFYIDPSNGQLFSRTDLEAYFKRIAVPSTGYFYKPLSNKRIIQLLLEELSKCFQDAKNAYKQAELKQLILLLED
jgi:regulator of sirC expression with transglutaminase-like and TPR domain